MVLPILTCAQTIEELQAEIKKFHKCFEEKSMPTSHETSVTLSNGKVVRFTSQSDYARSVFVSVDQLLEDVRLWKDSPYLWQLKHMKESKAIADSKDLSKWEVERFDKIAQSYFSGNNSAFHIAAHGLVNSSGQAANSILIGGQELNAKETAELIIQSMDNTFHHVINAEEQEFVVVIHSCHSADGENNFASQLSQKLAEFIPNVSVVGAPQTVYCSMQKNGEYTEYISSEQELKKDIPTNYKWKVYKNGKNTGQGTYDYKSTITKIQK
jgi:hypothetical protein